MAKRRIQYDQFWTVMARISVSIALTSFAYSCGVKLSEKLQKRPTSPEIMLPFLALRRCKSKVIKTTVQEQISLRNQSPDSITIIAADEAFYTAHPERNHRQIDIHIDSEEIVYEWKSYKDEAYWCYLEMTQLPVDEVAIR